MLSIFSDMVEKIVEVFMDDFSIYGDSFNDCLANLESALQRCEDVTPKISNQKISFAVGQYFVNRVENWDFSKRIGFIGLSFGSVRIRFGTCLNNKILDSG